MKTALEILKDFCYADFVERDPQKAADFLTEDILWFGLSEKEDVHSREEAFRYISGEVARNPEPYRIEYIHEHVTVTSEETSSALLKMIVSFRGVQLLCRVSASTRQENGSSKIAVLHLSLSNRVWQDEEYFPLTDVGEREKALREQLLNETVAGGMIGCYLEPGYPLYFVNERMPEVLGYGSPQEFVQAVSGKVINTIHPDDRVMVDYEVRRQLEQGGEYSIEYRMQKKDGSYIWIHEIGRTTGAEGGRKAVMCVHSDITEQRLAQQALAVSQSKLTAVIQYANLQTWEYDADQKKAYVTDCSRGTYQTEHIIENFPDSIIEQGYIHPEDIERYCRMHNALKCGEKECEEQIRIRRANSEEYSWIFCKYINVFGDLGKQGRAIGMAQSLDQYKELEQQFAISASQTGVSLWTLDIKSKRFFWDSQSFEPMYEVEMAADGVPEEVVYSDKILHPDDIQMVRQKYKELHAGVSPISFDARFRQKDGSYIWLRIFYTMIKDRNGKLLRAIGTSINISEQVEAKEKYNELVENYHKSVGADIILVGNCNITQNRMLGIIDSTESDLLGMFGKERDKFFTRFSQLIVDEAKRSDFLDMFLNEPVQKAYKKGERIFKLECLTKLPKAERAVYAEINVNVARSPESKDLIGFLRVRNIDAQKLAQIKLEETKQLISRVIERDYDFILDVNAVDDTYEMINSSIREIQYLPAAGRYSEFISDYIQRYVVKEDVAMVNERLECSHILNKLGHSSAYYFNFHAEENGKTSIKKINVFDISLHAGRIAVTCEDITEALEQEQKHNELLASALEAAERANAAKSDFLSRMSHEIRTPMNAILGLTQLAIMSGNASSDIADKLEKINVSSRFLLSLVNDVLDMSKIESQKMHIEENPFQLGMLMDELKEMFLPQAERKSIRFFCECSGEALVLTGDELRLKQVLVNLLSNAMKFTPENGHVCLRVKEESLKDGKAALRFSVEDNGIGIDRGDAERIFKAFEQAAVTGVHREGGTGLGLSISFNLVNLMGGRLELQSEAGQGSVFYFTLVFPLSDTKIERMDAELEGQLLCGKRFLLAEDNALNAEIAIELLKLQGAAVDWVENGRLAVERFTQHPAGYYSGILMDILMPEMTGLAAAEAIRACGRVDSPDIPIIAMTANAFQEDCDKAVRAGMNGFVPKPFEIKQLYQVLYECIG